MKSNKNMKNTKKSKKIKAFDFEDGNGLVPAHQHKNGGGWVADTAQNYIK